MHDTSDVKRRKSGENTDTPLTVNVKERYKQRYDRLSQERKIWMSEHLREVMYPEIDRIYKIEFPGEKLD